MYEYMIGSLEEQAMDYVVIDLNRMGYKVKVSTNTLNELPNLHSEVKLHLHQVIKEDEVSLADAGLDRLDGYWNEIRAREGSGGV